MSMLRRAVLFLLALGVVAGCATLDSKQSEWIFRPVRGDWSGYQGRPAGIEEVWLQVPGTESERIHAWWAPQADTAAPVLLYLHGARWNLSGSAYRIERLRDAGFSVFAIDYRGFGQSSGDLPTEAKAYVDAALAWDWLKIRVPQSERRYLYGHSLGGAVAIDLAAKLDRADAAGLITEATFTSVPDVIAASRYGWLPVGFLVTQRFEALEKIRKVALPTLILHGTEDGIVPHTMGDALFNAAAGPKQLVKFAGAGHSSIARLAFDEYRRTLLDFVAANAPTGGPAHAAR